MKITKSQLKKIIKEEFKKEVSEGFMDIFKSKEKKQAEELDAKVKSFMRNIQGLVDGPLQKWSDSIELAARDVVASGDEKAPSNLHRYLNALKDILEMQEQLGPPRFGGYRKLDQRKLQMLFQRANDLLVNLKTVGLDTPLPLADDQSLTIRDPYKRPARPETSISGAGSFAKGFGKGARSTFRTKTAFGGG